MISVLIMPFFTYTNPFKPRGSYDAQQQAVEWFRESPYKERFIYYSDPGIAMFMDIDPWDTSNWLFEPDTTLALEENYQNNAVIFWENNFGAKNTGYTHDAFLANPHFRLLNIFLPEENTISAMGDQYKLMVFERIPRGSDSIDYLTLSKLDFEGETPEAIQSNITSGYYFSHGHSFRFSQAGFSSSVTHRVDGLPGKEKVYLKAKGKFKTAPGYPGEKLILVMEIRDENEKMLRYLADKNSEIQSSGEWFELSISTLLEKEGNEDGFIRIYAWNQVDQPAWVDDLEIVYYPLEE
jgi:hypothetical protein